MGTEYTLPLMDIKGKVMFLKMCPLKVAENDSKNFHGSYKI
jgi:hypothetical protein